MPTLELPDFWLLFTPDGTWDGSVAAIGPTGAVRATAEQAHAHLVPNKRERDAHIRKGWTVRGGTRDELLALTRAMRTSSDIRSES